MSRTALVLKSLALAFNKEMAYKANFIIKVIALMVADFVGPIITTVIYTTTAGIPGWSFEQFLLLQGVFILVMGLMHFSQVAIAWRTVYEVREGTFDRFLTKPYKPLTYLSLTSWDPEGLGETFVGLVIIAYSMVKLSIPIISVNFLLFLLILALALVFTYSVIVIIASLSFLFIESFGLFNIFFQIMDIARYPSSIYSYGMRFFVAFLVPVTITATGPSIALIRGYSLIDLIWTVIPVIVFLLVSIGVWKAAMKKYASAGG